MLDTYLNQAVEYLKRTGTDKYGDGTYADPVVLPCRCEKSTKVIQTPVGALYQTTYQYFLGSGAVMFELMPWKDKLGGLTIAQVTELTLLDGTIEGYEVLV
jgi:hypothetical protein